MGFKELDSDRRFIAEPWMISVEVDIVREEAKGKEKREKTGNASGKESGCVHVWFYRLLLGTRWSDWR